MFAQVGHYWNVVFCGRKSTDFCKNGGCFQKIIVLLRLETKHVRIMTAIQMNAELYRAMGEIADDETLMKKVLKYVKKLAATKKADPTLMTKEEFFAHVDEALEQARQGRVHRIETKGELSQFLNSL